MTIERSVDRIRIVGAGLLFLLIFVLGYWLRRSGRPYNGIILTIHKLISLAAVVLLAITVYQVHQAVSLSAMELTAAVLTALAFLATIISGGLLSTDKAALAALLTLHQIGPYLTVLSSAATLYLLAKR